MVEILRVLLHQLFQLLFLRNLKEILKASEPSQHLGSIGCTLRKICIADGNSDGTYTAHQETDQVNSVLLQQREDECCSRDQAEGSSEDHSEEHPAAAFAFLSLISLSLSA